ncbi:hypothetical protein BZA77DRAFT_332610 [Pyronema omphalodes]|nr:hypothetical protein BZA77DRAFT_332610 [Pyronema omphalodes]
MATRCNSPPDKCLTSWSMKSSILRGLKAARTFLRRSSRTVPGNLGLIFWGFMEIDILGTLRVPSGCSAPASILQKVVFPVPFSPIMTIISESVKSPASTLRWKPPRVFSKVGDSSRKRKFSVGM